MSAQTLRAAPFFGQAAPRLCAACQRFLRAIDAFAQEKARRAVPEHELRRAQREIDRFCRLMHAHNRRAAKSAPATSAR
jgi:hypothetical protein